MRRILANENFPSLVVGAMRDRGHDVLWARTELSGAPDDVILQTAQFDERLIVTFDKDFGELAFRWGLTATCGVVLFRLHMQSPEYVRDRVIETLAQHSDWTGHFFVVEESRVRIRPLPTNNDEEVAGET